MTKLPKPGLRAQRGLLTLRSAISVLIDCKRDEGADGKRDADELQAALEYLDRLRAAAAAKATRTKA